jgi:phosphoribosylglycinamide formyltransferase 1
VRKIAVFASGTGTNAGNLIKYFSTRNSGKVVLVLSNKSHAPVLERAANLGVESTIFDREQFYNSREVLKMLTDKGVDFVVLAGFLWYIPEYLTCAFDKRIINIHPALLPAYGGKGMYGDRVHSAVLEAGEKESGITIHYVNEVYDSGDIIFQARCPVLPGDDIHSLAARVHELEYRYFPQVVEEVILKQPV